MQHYLHYLDRLQNATRKYWEKSALNTIDGESFTYAQMATLIEKFHLLFQKAGLQKGHHVALWARNSARWGMSYFAINTYGAVVVPLLADFTPDGVNALLDHSDSVALLTNADKWAQLDHTKFPKVKVVMDVDNLKILYCDVPGLEEFWSNIDKELEEVYPDGFGPEDVSYPTDNMDDLAVISYTSGSTGNPKGVMLTYRNFSAIIDFCQRHRPTSDKNRMVSMLPMAHMYGLVIEFIYPICNGTAIYWLGKAPTPTTLLKAFHEVKPYLLITVPLVMEKIFKSKIKPILDKPSVKVLCAIPGIRNIVFTKIRNAITEAFGGNVGEFILGGAAVNPEVEKWFKRIKLPYLVGYGMTEATPLLAYASHDEYVAGSCGKPVDCATVRIDSDDPIHIVGEIQAKGDNICVGYYKNPEASENAFTDDGYLRTGDLGLFDEDGNLFIRGRIKSMILTSNGQNVYPEEIESELDNMKYVAESLVVDRASKIVALVYLNQDAIKADGLTAEDIADIPERIRINANKRLPAYSKIAMVEIQDQPFEKTPKMSIKRFLYK
jgi:long-chain acyl-CoA synthetase